MIILALINTIILLLLGALHFYWAFGGSWGVAESLPTNESGERVLNPKSFDSIFVGVMLAVFAFAHLLATNLIQIDLPDWFSNYALWVIGVIFILRAIGEFRYVGFFKKIKGTQFGRNDTRYYSPLCLLMGLNAIFVQMM